MTSAATVASRVVGAEVDQDTRDHILNYLMSSERGMEVLGEIWASNTETPFYWSDSGTYANGKSMFLDRHDDLGDLKAGAAHEIYHVQEYMQGRRASPGQAGYVQSMLLEEANAHATAFIIHLQTGEGNTAPHHYRDFRGRFGNIVNPGRGQEVNFRNVHRAAEFYSLQAMSSGSWLTSNSRERYDRYYERFHNAALQAAAQAAGQTPAQPYQTWQPTPAKSSSEPDPGHPVNSRVTAAAAQPSSTAAPPEPRPRSQARTPPFQTSTGPQRSKAGAPSR